MKLQAALVTAVYLAVGVRFYTTFEYKPCEHDGQPDPMPPHAPWHAKFFARPPPPECREPWTVVDALYFCTVSMSTVGYGDLSPSSEETRIFSIGYILIGITVVFVQISNACSGVLMAANEPLLAVLDRFDVTPKGLAGRSLGLSGQAIDIDGNGVADFVLPPHPFIYWVQEMAIMLPLMLLLQLLSAAIFVAVQPGLTFWQSLYHSLITATTVGYGDVELTEQLARLWAVVHILFSVTWLAALLSHVDELAASRRQALRRADLLRKQLDRSLIASLDHDGNGVDKLEFCVGMLITLGAEVCGQPLSWEDVRPFLVKFDSLDVDKSGRIEKSDLELMVQRNAQAVKGKLERSKSNTTCNASHRAHDHIWQSLFRRP